MEQYASPQSKEISRNDPLGCARSQNQSDQMCIRDSRKGDSDLITSIGYADLCSEKFMEAIEPEIWGYMEAVSYTHLHQLHSH